MGCNQVVPLLSRGELMPPGIDSLINALVENGGIVGIIVAVFIFGYTGGVVALIFLMKMHRQERDEILSMYRQRMDALYNMHENERSNWKKDLITERHEDRELHERSNVLHDRTNQVLNDLRVLIASLNQRGYRD